MMKTRFFLATATFLFAGISVSPAAAAPVRYAIESTPVVNCTDSPHGLWTNNLMSGSCGNYFDIQPDSYIDIDEEAGTGRLYGSAENPFGNLATFDVSLGGWLETTEGTGFEYKEEGGPSYNPATDTPDIDFFTTVGADSAIHIDGVEYLFNINDPFTGNTVFQYGGSNTGANAKNDDLGASAWINIAGQDRHWDFNLNMVRIDDPQDVAEPATLALIGTGLLGFAAWRRRRTHASAIPNPSLGG